MDSVLAFIAKFGLAPDAATVALIAAVVVLYFSTIGKDYLLHVIASCLVALVASPAVVALLGSSGPSGWSLPEKTAAIFVSLLVLAQFSLMRSPFAYPLSTPRGVTRILWLITAVGFISASLFSLGALTATTPLVISIFTASWSVGVWLAIAWALLIFFRNDE